MLHLSNAKKVIVVGGCLGMAHVQLALSPATIDFARKLGGGGLHVGILGALPIGLVFMQLVAALAANHLDRRKPTWFWVSILQRLAYLPVAIGPWLYPDAPSLVWVWLLIVLVGVNQSLLHFSTPLWMSWMSDYLPHQGLSSYWGLRHRWTQWTAAAAFLFVALLFFKSGLEIRAAFGIVMAAAVVLGVADILLFIGVEEPPLRPASVPNPWHVMTAPFRHVDFRSFIYFSCFWNLACMIGAPFISLFLLQFIGMDLFHVLLLWAISWIGGSLCSQKFGVLVDTHGQRPVLILCTAFKSLLMAALLFTPRNPTLAFWFLIPSFMLDAFLNSGITIANNGFLLKNSPREQRTMFIAAGTAFAGLVGGAASIITGAMITATRDSHLVWHGLEIVNFHWAFGVSLVLRLASVGLALGIRESGAHGTRYVLTRLTGITLPWLVTPAVLPEPTGESAPPRPLVPGFARLSPMPAVGEAAPLTLEG